MLEMLVRFCACGALLASAPLTVCAGIITNSSGGSNSVTLGWKPSPDTAVVGYSLCYGYASGQCTNQFDIGNATNATLGGLETSVTYFFNVVAYSASGQRSPPSNEVQYSLPRTPTLAPIPDTTVNEGTLLTFAAAASDPDTPANQLSFALGAGAPAGASISSPGGVFTWTPGEADGPSTNALSVIVTDNGSPSLSATQTFAVVIREMNNAPQLAPIPPQSISEGSTLTLTAAASDSDIPANSLIFSLGVGAPPAAHIDPTTGILAWTPDEADGPSTNTISVIVTDNGSPSLSATQTFAVVIHEVNNAPHLAPIPSQSISEGSTLTLTAAASDSDIPANNLIFSLGVGAPPAAHIDPTTGILTWTPDEADGPSTNTISVIVTDNGSPSLSATQTFAVVIHEVNNAPHLAPIPPQSISEGSTLTLTAVASDSDIPANSLIFSLGVGAPPAAHIDATTGILAWTPDEADGPSTNTISVIVTDNGSPSLSATQAFVVVVNELNAPPLLTALPSQTILEGATLIVTNLASDPDVPANILTFNLGPGAPAGVSLDPQSGVLRWTPGASDAGTNLIPVIVTDNGTPALSAAQSIVVVVQAQNRPPIVDPVTPQTVAEGSTLVLTNKALNPNTPAGQLMFSLGPGAPAGAFVNPTNGLFTWTPGEDQGPSTHAFPLVVTDSGSTGLTATQMLSVMVTEVNSAPQMTGPADQLVYAGMPISVGTSATDSDLPVNRLLFTLAGGAPAGAQINGTNGLFTWTPGPDEAGTTNTVTVIVTDDGQPPLSASHSFTIAVVARPVIESLAVTNGTVTLAWPAVAGSTYRVQFKQSLEDVNWTDLSGDVAAAGMIATRSDTPDASTRFYRVVVLP